VYNFDRSDIGLRIIARNNFYNWKISVISDIPITTNFDGLFYTRPPIDPEYTGDPLSACYFEGFPKALVFGYYHTNKSCWSAEIHSDTALWTVMYLIMKSKGQIKSLEWEVCKEEC
jgi:hypothetical protein